jgi:hypothetical protein
MNRDSATESKGSEKGGLKSTQSDEKMAPGAKNQRAQDEGKRGQDEKNQRAQDDKRGEDRNQRAQDERAGQKGKSAQDNNMSGDRSKGLSENDKGANRDRNNMNAERNGAERSQTTGQAGAGAKLSTEQRTKITTVIKNEHVAPVTNVNFSVSVGTRVPRDVSFRPLPAEVVSIYPEWRGYNFVLVREQIVVIDPRTFEIVAVIDA